MQYENMPWHVIDSIVFCSPWIFIAFDSGRVVKAEAPSADEFQDFFEQARCNLSAEQITVKVAHLP